MRLIGQDVLVKGVRKHADTRDWLRRWMVTVEASTWKSIDQVRLAYPSADGVRTGNRVIVTVFNVKGNTYRLLTWIDYNLETVEVLELLSHAQYSKDF